MYPFDGTADGRMVAQQFGSRQENERFHQRSLNLQEQTLRTLSDLHGGTTVNREDFLRSQGETQSVLRNMVEGQFEIWREQASTTDAVGVLNQISAQGFNQVHEDLGSIDAGVRGVRQAIQKDIHGPEYPQHAVASLIVDPQSFFEALSVYEKGMLVGDNDYELESLIDRKIGSVALQNEIREELIANLKKRRKSMGEEAYLNEVSAISSAVSLLSSPSLLLREHPTHQENLQLLVGYAGRLNNPKLNNFLAQAKGLKTLAVQARNTPLSKDTLIEYTNNGLLPERVQHTVKRQHREARLSGTLVDLNYNALEALEQGDVAIQQRDTANYFLENIVGSIAESNSHLINLEYLVRDVTSALEQGFGGVISTLEYGFNTVARGLQNVASEIALTRAEIVMELNHIEQTMVNVGNGLHRDLKQANTLLAKLIWLQENSHTNEARQFLEDGIKILRSATTRRGVEQAFRVFAKGTESQGSSAANHFGVGIAAELLGDIPEAQERYHMAADFSPDNPELTSGALENLARLAHQTGNLPEALKLINQAVEKDPENLTARYSQARYCALLGDTDTALEVLKNLITKEESYLARFRIDSAFTALPLAGVHELLSDLYEDKSLRRPILLMHLMWDFLLLQDEEKFFAVLSDLLKFSPLQLLKKKLWKHPLFGVFQTKISGYLTTQVQANDFESCAQPLYSTTILLMQLGVNPADLIPVFTEELGSDSASYEKNKKVAQEKILARLREVDPTLAEQLLAALKELNPPNLPSWLFA
jgi:tetratricopeptide (TPR) repeat protein